MTTTQKFPSLAVGHGGHGVRRYLLVVDLAALVGVELVGLKVGRATAAPQLAPQARARAHVLVELVRVRVLGLAVLAAEVKTYELESLSEVGST